MSRVVNLLSLLRSGKINVSDLSCEDRLLVYSFLSNDPTVQKISTQGPTRATIPRNNEGLPYIGNFKRPIRSPKSQCNGSQHTFLVECNHSE